MFGRKGIDNMEYKEFEKNIFAWARKRGMIDNVSSSEESLELMRTKQASKIGEEYGELLADFNKRKHSKEHAKHLRDSVGDVLVTLLIFAKQNGLTLEECWDKSWSHIKDRDGQMVDGVYVKKQDMDR